MKLTKYCRGCHNDKDSSEFRKHKGGVKGLDKYCKDCRNKQYQRKKLKTIQKGEEVSWYELKLKEQGGVCAICGADKAYINSHHNYTDFNIDHCHITNKVRGLLCSNCNSGMGKLKDDKELLKKAIEYLEKYE